MAAVKSIKNLAGTVMASMKLREKIQKFEDLHELVLPFHEFGGKKLPVLGKVSCSSHGNYIGIRKKYFTLQLIYTNSIQIF